jgi:hypothetical protein
VKEYITLKEVGIVMKQNTHAINRDKPINRNQLISRKLVEAKAKERLNNMFSLSFMLYKQGFTVIE